MSSLASPFQSFFKALAKETRSLIWLGAKTTVTSEICTAYRPAGVIFLFKLG